MRNGHLHFFKIIGFIQLFLVVPMLSTAMCHTEDFARHAVGVLKGVYNDYSKEEAIANLKEAAENDTIAYAMNALGLAYLEGTGTKKNPSEAIIWLEKAGNHGIADAFQKLGAIYKTGRYGICQDYTKAFEYFLRGAELGSTTCNYDAGFMLYKGLGCEQNYCKSIELFANAAQHGHSAALYMLGLCYRNGYGTSIDESKGIDYLNKAADLGYKPALEEIMRPYPENCLHNVFLSEDNSNEIPVNMPEIQSNVNDTSLIREKYEGFIVMYDYSGKYILSERSVSMSAKRNGLDITGKLTIEDDSIPFAADILSDGSLRFKKSYTELNERYAPKGKASYRLDYAKLDIRENKIKGKLVLYSLKQREPERPMYIELLATDTSKDNHSNSMIKHIKAVHNPFYSSLKTSFELRESCDVNIRIYDKYGKIAWQQFLEQYDSGKHTIKISPDLMPGYYVLSISAGKQTLRSIIIKEG